jgi:hypothetical protein
MAQTLKYQQNNQQPISASGNRIIPGLPLLSSSIKPLQHNTKSCHDTSGLHNRYWHVLTEFQNISVGVYNVPAPMAYVRNVGYAFLFDEYNFFEPLTCYRRCICLLSGEGCKTINC